MISPTARTDLQVGSVAWREVYLRHIESMDSVSNDGTSATGSMGSDRSATPTESSQMTRFEHLSIAEKNSKTFMAAQAGETRRLTLLLGAGADVDYVDEKGRTALYVGLDSTECVEILLICGANVNAQNKLGNTPLHKAAQKQLPKIVALLLKNKPSLPAIPIRNSSGETALCVACRYATLMEEASAMKIVNLLYENGHPINNKHLKGEPLLHEVLSTGCKGLAKLLITRGIDVNIRDSESSTTALSIVCRNRQWSLVGPLISAGARVDHKTGPWQFGDDILHHACRDQNVDSTMIGRLVKIPGIDINHRGKNGETPLEVIARTDRIDVAKVLIDHGARLDVGTIWKSTALQTAILCNRQKMVRLLIDRGADIDLRVYRETS